MQFSSQTVGAFLEQLPAKTPAPGGGATACVAGALAAAQAQMVVAYSIGKKNLSEYQDELRRAEHTLVNARAMLLELADEDAAAYGMVNELMKLPETDPRRVREMPAAADRSVQIPRAALATCSNAAALFERLASITNRMLRSDLAIAAVLNHAAAESCDWNVRVNLASIPEGARGPIEKDCREMLKAIAGRRDATTRACAV